MRYLYLIFIFFLSGCQQKEKIAFVVDSHVVLNDTTKPYTFPFGIVVSKKGILEIKSGVEIALGKRQSLIVYGSLNAQGQSKKSIKIFAQDSLFNRIVFKAGSKNNIISFANIIDGAFGIENTTLKLIHVNMYFNTPRETEIAWPVIYSKSGNIEIRNSYIINRSGGWVGEGIVALGGTINIFDSGVLGIPDAIEFTQVNNSLISNINISKSGDDGIDLNSCKNITITNAIIKNIADKAITIGGAFGFSEVIDSLPTPPSTSIKVSNCLIQNSKIGISVKDSSEIFISESAFSDIQTGFKIYEKNKGQGTGKLTLKNSLVINYSSFSENPYVSNFTGTSVITDKNEPTVENNIVVNSFRFPNKINPKDFKYNQFIKKNSLE